VGALRPLSELRSSPLTAQQAAMMLDAALPADSAAAAYLASLSAPGEHLAASGAPRAAANPAAAGTVWLSADELLADASFGLAGRLEQAWVLGTTSQQPAATGLRSVGSARFDVWEDSLASL
jgi:hypothetical protein